MAVNKRLLQGAAAGGLVPSENFKAVLYTGNGSGQSITGVGFQPDFVWIKRRTDTSSHQLFDSTRGATYNISSDLNLAETQNTQMLTSFDTDGFSLGNHGSVNNNGTNYVAWCWKSNGGTTSSNTDGTITSTVQVNEQAGFSIVSYTGNGTASSTIGHGFSAAPEMVIVKNLSSADNWIVYNKYADSSPASGFLQLNQTAAFYIDSDAWGGGSGTEPSSTLITIGDGGTDAYTNKDGSDYIAYCFKSTDSFSKFGSYEGNGTTEGPMVETGFEPAFIIIKDVDGLDNWAMVDNKRATTNPRQTWLRANLDNAEFSNTVDSINFYSNGFQIAGGTSVSNFLNENGNTFIYMAFAADPDTEAPTLADSFAVKTYTGTGSAQTISGLGFKPSFLWTKQTDGTFSHIIHDTLNQPHLLITNSTGALITNGSNTATFTDDGFSLEGGANHTSINNSGSNFVAWAWKANDNEPTIFGGPALAVYKFEDNANDVTGDYNATANNITYTSSGKFNKAADFNGTNSYAETSLTTNLTSFTWSCWINPDVAWSGDITTIVKGFYSGASNTNYQYLGFTGGDFRFQFRNNSSFSHVSSSVTPAVGQWSHIVATIDGGTSIKIYINGVLTGSGTNSTTISNTNAISIGGASSIFGPFDGKIDQVRIYRGALPQEQVTELYNETASDNDDLTLGSPPKSIVSANANAGFSIVKFTSPSTNTTGFTIPHGLSSAPDLILTKPLDAAVGWHVYSSVFSNPAQSYLRLETTDALYTGNTNIWNNTAATSTVFSMKTGYAVGTSSETIAYCFHSVSGYSKFGSYQGNGSGSGQTITTGFQPDWIILKSTSVASEWVIVDSVRGDAYLLAESAGAEVSPYTAIDFLSTGFKLTGTSYNESGRTFIYWTHKIN